MDASCRDDNIEANDRNRFVVVVVVVARMSTKEWPEKRVTFAHMPKLMICLHVPKNSMWSLFLYFEPFILCCSCQPCNTIMSAKTHSLPFGRRGIKVPAINNVLKLAAMRGQRRP